MGKKRDATIDVLRGLAVFTMIPANMCAGGYVEPHAFWFRVWGSFAAPMFILLSGYMVAANCRAKSHGLSYYLKRGAMVLCTAALIDLLVWRIYPFTAFDVLYLIGISMPLIYLFRKHTSGWVSWAVLIAVFALGPVLQWLLGYSDYPTEFYFNPEEQVELPANLTSIPQHYFVDGWFPLFPWLGFGLLGSLLADLRGPGTADAQPALGKFALPAFVGLLAVGLAAWWFYPGPMLTREGYSELFYPPVPGFILTSAAIAVGLFWVVDFVRDHAVFQPLRLLGESALLMYILHQAADSYYVWDRWPEEELGPFMIVTGSMILALMVVGLLVRQLKKVWPNQPMVVKFLLGG